MERGDVERLEKRTEFRWRLREFYSLDDRVDSVYVSPEFRFCGRRWRLGLFPNGRTWRHSEGDVELCLYVCDSGPPTEVRYSAGIVTSGGGTVAGGTATKTFERPLEGVWITVLGRSDLFRRRDELLPGDELALTITLEEVGASSETVLKDASVQATVETCDVEVSVQTPVENNATCDERCETSEKRDFEKLREHFRLWLEHPEEGERIRRLRMEELEKREKREKVAKKQPPEKEWTFFAA